MKQLIFGGSSIITGRGSLEYLQEVKNSKVFVVTGGSSMLKNGTVASIENKLTHNGCSVLIHTGIPKNPDEDTVLIGVQKMRDFEPDVLLAVGGGSAMDAAKVMGLFYEYPELNFANVLTAELPSSRKKIKLIAVPSTSGTASEVTRAAVITFKAQNLKIGLKTPAFIPDIAILDANLTLTMPDNVVAETGMDAMTHAVECYINQNADDFAAVLAKGAVEGLFKYLPESYKKKSSASREKVHHYQCIAGLAFDNTGLGIAHGISHAVGGMFNLGHGLLNAIILPYALEYNSQNHEVSVRLQELAKAINQPDFIAAIKGLNAQLNIPGCLRAAGITEQEFNAGFSLLVDNSLKGATRVNPVPIDREQMVVLLKQIFTGYVNEN